MISVSHLGAGGPWTWSECPGLCLAPPRLSVQESSLCLLPCFLIQSLTNRSCLCVLGTQILLGSDSAWVMLMGRGPGETRSVCLPSANSCMYVISFTPHNNRAMGVIIACVCAKLLHSCPTPCDPMDCNPPGSSVHGILQARILE